MSQKCQMLNVFDIAFRYSLMLSRVEAELELSSFLEGWESSRTQIRGGWFRWFKEDQHLVGQPISLTINKVFIVNFLRRLRENVQRERPELWSCGEWVFTRTILLHILHLSTTFKKNHLLDFIEKSILKLSDHISHENNRTL